MEERHLVWVLALNEMSEVAIESKQRRFLIYVYVHPV